MLCRYSRGCKFEDVILDNIEVKGVSGLYCDNGISSQQPAGLFGVLQDNMVINNLEISDCYNLAGQRVSNSVKGIVIKKGIKYLRR